MSASTSGCTPRRVRQCRARACALGLGGVGQEGRGRVTARESMGARAQHDGWKAKESNRLRVEYHARARRGATHHPETDQSQHARHALRYAHSPPSTARTQVALLLRAKSGRGAYPFQNSPDIAAVARPSFLKPLEAAFRATGPPWKRATGAGRRPVPHVRAHVRACCSRYSRLHGGMHADTCDVCAHVVTRKWLCARAKVRASAFARGGTATRTKSERLGKSGS